ncbi:hypothetical protein D9619_006945 [Psilocybe cf. subviscida]|uniref:Methyltransferase domain-containing protein n=1 Tax=Psilocybe cf. subviscida TaxID=2480587 RepID=A0A8H5B1D3_9AGAR|nr:hypothetical protein D9619_006945 [Psilocybe cf. subviscida]
MDEHSAQPVGTDSSNSPSSGAQTLMHASASGSSGAHAAMQPPTAQGQHRSHMGQQALRSRHSSFNLSQHASNSPTSSGAPSPPLDSSTRQSQMPRSKVSSGQSTPVPKRPSTAESTKKREEITPWEFDDSVQPTNVQQQDTRAHHAPPRPAPSVRSRTSSIPLGSLHATGPVEDVTPWEIHPGPGEEPKGSGRDASLRPRANTSASNSSSQSGGGGIGYGISIEKDFGPDKSRMVASASTTMSLRSRASSAALAVGSLEEVTPWEVQELVIEEEERDEIPSPLRSPALSHPHSQSHAANASGRSRASSIAQRGTGTGPVAEVTPWEIQALLLEEDEEAMDDVEEEPSQHRKSVDDRASVVSTGSASKQSSRSGISSRFSRKSERKSVEMERIGEPGGKLGLTDRRKSFASGTNANIRASIEFGIKGGLGYGVPIEKHYEAPNLGLNGPSGTAANGQGGLELVENVTPWELYPVPPVPPLPSDLQPPLENQEQETVTKRPKSRFIASKAMLTLKGRGSHKGAEKDAQKKQAKEAARVSTISNGSQGLSSPSLQVTNTSSTNIASAAASTSSLTSYTSNPSNGHLPYNQPSLISGSSQHSLPQAQRPAMTGTVEDVLPWELHEEIPPVPPLPSVVVSDPTSGSSSEVATPMPSYGQSQFALAQSRTGSTGSTQAEFQSLRAGVKLELASMTSTPQSTSRVQTPMLSLPLPVGPLVEVNSWDREGTTDAANPDRLHELYDQVSDHDPNHLDSPVEARNHRLGSNPPSPIEASAAAVGRKTSLPVLKRSPPAPSYTPSPTQPYTPSGTFSIAQSISSGTTATGTSISASVASAGTGTGTSAKQQRGSMTTEQLEEVTPWELQPGPDAKNTIREEDPPGSAGGSMVGGGSGSVMSQGDVPRQTSEVPLSSGVPTPGPIRQSASAGVPKSKGLGDLAIRRRRSTGASGAAAAAASLNRKSGKLVSKERARVAAENGEISIPSPHSAESPHDEDEGQGRQFSTADRTILQQLKDSIKAKNAQFVLKGVGQTVLGGGKGSGKKHHPFSPEEVPYPRSYDRDIVDLDVWETMVTQQLADSVTWHVFETPPTRVLDIGCGTGTWILQCATKWKKSHFTGLDVVPLHPNLQNLGSANLSSRVKWVQHNCLDGLPFQNEEFDFVHIKRIALGVPESLWDAFLEEIARVMKPGGALEVIEEDLFFPGTRHVEDDDNGLLVVAPNPSSVNNALHRTSSMQTINFPGDGESTATPRVGNVSLPPTGSSSPPVVSRALGPSGDIASNNISPQLSTGTALSNKPVIHVVTQHNAKEADPFNDLFGASSVMVMGSMAIATQNDPITELFKKQHQQEKDDNATLHSGASGSWKNGSIRKQSPFLLRSLTRSPVNPRDHSILAAVWQGMLESRFINMTPLSLLENYLGYHFKDIRTHAPLFYTFPHVIRKPTAVEESKSKSPQETPQQNSLNLSDPDNASNSSDDDEARDAIIPRPRVSKSSLSPSSSSLSSHPEPSVPTEAGCPQINANEPSTIQFPSSSNPGTIIQDVKKNKRPLAQSDSKFSKLPNGAMNVDVRTLNVHLSLRAKEILACSESMWEYVEACQGGSQPIHGRKFATGFDSADSDDLSSTNLIMDMTRDDFDILLNHFEMDMLDKAGVGQALEAQYSWSTFPSATPLDDRNAFDKACAKYDQWVADQRRKSSIDGHTDSPSSSVPPTGIVLPDHKSSISSLYSNAPSDTVVADDWFSLTSTSRQSHNEAASIPLTYTDIPPEKLLSRVLRVYVAWKSAQ